MGAMQAKRREPAASGATLGAISISYAARATSPQPRTAWDALASVPLAAPDPGCLPPFHIRSAGLGGPSPSEETPQLGQDGVVGRRAGCGGTSSDG